MHARILLNICTLWYNIIIHRVVSQHPKYQDGKMWKKNLAFLKSTSRVSPNTSGTFGWSFYHILPIIRMWQCYQHSKTNKYSNIYTIYITCPFYPCGHHFSLTNLPRSHLHPHPMAVRLHAGSQRLDALAPYDEELWGDALLVQGQNTRLVPGWKWMSSLIYTGIWSFGIWPIQIITVSLRIILVS